MNIKTVFITVWAKSHTELVDWWTKAIGRSFDRKPVKNCCEWELTKDVLLQVIDSSERKGNTYVSLRIENLDGERQRMIAEGIDLSEPELVPGFERLHWAKVKDPEGNELNFLEGK